MSTYHDHRYPSINMISTTIIVIVVIVILIMATIVFWSVGQDAKGNLKRYSVVITGVGIILVFLTFIYEAIFQEKEEKAIDRDNYLALTSSGWIGIEKDVYTNYPYLERLYSQIYPDIPIVVPQVSDPIKQRDMEVHMCQILFQNLDNVFVSNGGLSISWETQQPEWLYTFRSWFTSEIVKEVWSRAKRLYSSEMILFIDKQIIPHPITQS